MSICLKDSTVKLILLFIVFLLSTGCAFTSLDTNKCGAGEYGNECTPVTKNISNMLQEKEPEQEFSKEIDKAVMIDEYTRISSKSPVPAMLTAKEARIRIYAYSDGDRFYDSRDVYIVVQKNGWNKGSYVYSPNGKLELIKKKYKLPAKVKVTSGGLNIRAGAGDAFLIKDTLSKGTVVHPKKELNGWYYISTEDKDGEAINGWVYSKYTKKVE